MSVFSTTTPTTAFPSRFATHDEMPLEDVAARLGLPVEMLLRRVEAGDLPARRVVDITGSHYFLRPEYLGTVAEAFPADPPVAELKGVSEASAASILEQDEIEMSERETQVGLAELLLGSSGRPQQVDPRELIASLLDRWERTLEQRIYIEQRQRFERELNDRHAELRLLERELQMTRAQHAAAEADKDRIIAEREHALAEREHELSVLRASRKGWRLFRH